MKNILVIFGTRPEVVKLAPVILELKKYPNKYNVIVCNTEQQKELSNQTLSFFGLNADISLDIMRPNQTLAGLQSRLIGKLETVFIQHKIDAAIVQGDTMSVLSGALVSFYNKVPVFHVEAGLRSYDLFEPFPEEAIRQMVSRVTALHFAPTIKAVEALVKEGIDSGKIILTGNTVVDALGCLPEKVMQQARHNLLKKGILLNDKLVLVTVHRRENHGERLDKILESIQKLAATYPDHQFVMPVHPNPNVKEKVYNLLAHYKNIVLTAPMDYPELIALMKITKLVLTDSGGIQEEAPAFGNTILVMRYETERMEGVEAGFSHLVGADADNIFSAAARVLDKPLKRLDGSKNPYGDGYAAQKIEQTISSYWR